MYLKDLDIFTNNYVGETYQDGRLIIIGDNGLTYKLKRYYVKCSECSKDPELFGDGIFPAYLDVLRKGGSPCGCASSYARTEDQVKILTGRKCKEKDYIFHGFFGKFRGNQTKLSLECPKHGKWNSTCFSDLNMGKGCTICGNSITNRLPDEAHIEAFFKSGVFQEGTKFWKSDKRNKVGYDIYWNYTCPVCSNDEYVKAGLCSGVFTSGMSDLKAGRKSCRCSKAFKWTEEQRTYNIISKMKKIETTDIYVGWVTGFKDWRSKFIRKCLLHGEYETSVNGFLYRSHGCPQCSNHAQKQSYINSIFDDEDNLVAIKFGIAKDYKTRFDKQKYKTPFKTVQSYVWDFPTVPSCKSAEKEIKDTIICKFLPKEQYIDGYTETTSPENLNYIISIFEKYGGVRKVTENNKNKEAA